jgi:hypothetical protein
MIDDLNEIFRIELIRKSYHEHLLERPEDFTKPVVHFNGEPEFFEIGQNEVARVHALDHPFWGKDILRTSSIVKKFEDGSFETRNTMYVKVNND